MAGNVKKVFENISAHFDSEAWGDRDAVLQFDISGDDGGTWTATVEGGAITVVEGAAMDPDMTVITADEDMLAIVNGDLNAVSAFMSGKVRIAGDMSLAMKLQNLLSSR